MPTLKSRLAPITDVLLDDVALPPMSVQWVWRTPKMPRAMGGVRGYLTVGDEVLALSLVGGERVSSYRNYVRMATTHGLELGSHSHRYTLFGSTPYLSYTEGRDWKSSSLIAPDELNKFARHWDLYFSTIAGPLASGLLTETLAAYLARFPRISDWPDVPVFTKSRVNEAVALEIAEVKLPAACPQSTTMPDGIARHLR